MKAACFGIVLAVSTLLAEAAAGDDGFSVATWNVEWFYDQDTSDDTSNIGDDFAAPSEQEFQDRVDAVADAIAQMDVDVVAVQEIENDTVVQAVADRLADEHSLNYQVAFVQGRDTQTGQDVAFLVRDEWELEPPPKRFDFSTFDDPEFKDLSKHLAISIKKDGQQYTLVTVHLITRTDERIRQAHTLRAWTEDLVAAGNLIVLGDMNSSVRFNQTTPDSDIGIIRGFGTAETSDDLFDAHQRLTGPQRRTHVSGRELDRILLSPDFVDGEGLEFVEVEQRRDLAIRGDEDDSPRRVDYSLPPEEQDVSDHFPLIVRFQVASEEEHASDVRQRLQEIESQLESLLEEVRGLRETLE